jgi:hypothetical protein
MRTIRCFRTTYLLPLAALLALAACATGNPVGPGGITSVSAPQPPRVGDEWRYRVTSGYSKEERGIAEIKVVEATGDRVVIEASGFQPGRWTMTPDQQWITHPLADDRVQTFSPAYPSLVFPLAAGQKWDIKVAGRDNTPDIAYRSVAGPTDGVTVQGWVTGWERIKVPAGEFDVIKIKRITWGGNFTYDYSQSEIYEDLWYAPSIGKVVRHESRWQRLAFYTRLRDGPLYLKGDWLIRELLPPGAAPDQRAALVQ